MKRRIRKLNSGFTLLEAIVLLALGAIIISVSVSLYVQIIKLNARQQSINEVERGLLDIQSELKQSLTTMPGRSLGTFAEGFSTPQLPSIGDLPNDKGILTPVRLGIVTPFKYNGEDAFSIVYTDSRFPRLELGGTTAKKGTSEGSAKIVLPIVAAQQYIRTRGEANINKAFSKTDNNNQTQDLQTRGESSPSPSPSPSPSSSPTKGIPSGEGTPIPPAIPANQTLSGLPFAVDASMFNVGDTFLLVGTPEPTGATYNLKQQYLADSRLVKITRVTQSPTVVRPGENTTVYLEITYDLCLDGPCGEQFPGLRNVPSAPIAVTVGGLLVPIRISSFYMKRGRYGERLVRNDGGVFTVDGNGSAQIQGGQETDLGPVNKISVSYKTKTGEVYQTPNTPLIPWLNDIIAIDVALVKKVERLPGTEELTRKLNVSFPIVIRNLE